MADQWLVDLEKARKNALSIGREIGGGGCKLEARQSALLRGQLAQLKHDVSHLERMLMTISQNTQAYSITKKELSRRGDLLAQLSEQVERVQDAIRNGAQRQLQESSTTASSSEPAWRGDRRGGASREHGDRGGGRGGGKQDFVASSEQEIQEQDDTLDFLHGTVRNLKNMGSGISQEIDVHCQMLSELEDSSDKSTSRVRQQQGKLNQLSESSSCYLWAYICVMSSMLCVLLVFF
mmetsp:Transcript_112093/g.362026  ORF Transcript_112093/g.362026 Transcript_112093/m.362026 type:complete len:236 (-) Transcript_112093:11-718(-)